MFDLEQAIGEWRREMRACGINDHEILDELESHLRDDVEQETCSGCDLKASFEVVVTRMGQRSALQSEFQKVCTTTALSRLRRALRVLAGVPDYQLANNMNTYCENTNVEARWATYAKAAVFLAPSLILWMFSCLFMMPKLKQICGNAGLALPNVFGLALFATSHFILISAALLASLILLEWRSSKWSRYRRATLGTGVFLINTLVLLVITMMVFSALLAAPAMAHSGN